MYLEDYILNNAHNIPHKIAVICGDKSLTYSQLLELINQRVTDFWHLQRGSVVVFRASQDIDFLITYFAIHICGLVAAPVEHDMPIEKFDVLQKQLSNFTLPEFTADILYTTGTTGKSKGVIISHKAILADADNLIEGLEISADVAFVISGPLNHIGSLSKIYPIIKLGGTLIITSGIKDLNSFFDAFSLPYNKMATFLVPSAIRILLQFSSERLKQLASKIDFIETGAAAMPLSDMQLLCKVLPNTRLYNTYASTETGVVATYNYNDGQCIANCLGKPMSNSKIIISNNGYITCTGNTIMSGYAGDPELTSKILQNNTIYTTDLGTLDEFGRLILIGRSDDVINIGGYKVAPTEVEAVVMELPQIADCICVAAPHIVIGTVLKLIYVLKPNENIDIKAIAKYLKSKLESFKVPFYYKQADNIKRTYNGKLDRKFYRNDI